MGELVVFRPRRRLWLNVEVGAADVVNLLAGFDGARPRTTVHGGSRYVGRGELFERRRVVGVGT